MRRARALVLTLVAAACSDNPAKPLVPATVVATSPTTQEAQVGTAVAVAPAVKVSAASGEPVGGVTVTFSIATGGGSLVGATRTTDAGGIASVESWTLGTAAGFNRVTATVSGLTPVSFAATGRPGPAASVAMAPDHALIEIGKTLELTAIFRDEFGNATGRAAAWSSDNPAVATVSSNGIVTGVVNGSATITATSEGKTGAAKVDVQGVNSALANGDFEAGDPTFGWTIGGTRNYAVTRTPSPEGNAALLSVGQGPTTTSCDDPSQSNFVYIDQRFRVTKERVIEVDFRVPVPSDEDASESSTCPGWDRVEIDFGIGGTAKPPWGNATGVVLIDYIASLAEYRGHMQVNDFVTDKVTSAAFDPATFSPVTLGPLKLTNGPTPGWLRASFDVSTSQFQWLVDEVELQVTFRVEDTGHSGRNSSIAIDKVSTRPK